MTRIFALFFVFLLSACPKAPADLEPEALLEAGQARKVPYAMRGKFSAKIVFEEAFPSLPGAVILHKPARFRIAVNAPIGGPVFTFVSNGEGVGLILHSAPEELANTYILVEDARDFLGEGGEGGVGLESFTSLLMGTLPYKTQTPIRTEEDEEGTLFVYAGPAMAETQIRLHNGGELLQLEIFNGEGKKVFTLRNDELMKVAGIRMPKSTVIESPIHGLQLKLKYSDWAELAQIPDAFGLEAPSGVEVIDVETAFQRLAPELNDQD